MIGSGANQGFYVGDLMRIPIIINPAALFMVLLCWMWAGGDTAYAAILLLVLSSGILLHELGHGLAARFFGAKDLTITMGALGGVCSSRRDNARPLSEIVILVAGPLVSFILSAIGFGLLYGFLYWQPSAIFYTDDVGNVSNQLNPLGRTFQTAFILNLVLGIFNSLPIYPLDGGQVVWNILRMVVKRRDWVNTITLVLTCVTAALFLLAAHLYLGGIQPFTLFIVGIVLFNAFVALRNPKRL